MGFKALVVEHVLDTVRIVEEVLAALGHEHDIAASLVEARKLLRANGYDYVVLNGEIPARVSGPPRLQNAENFLDDLRAAKGDGHPPVIVLLAMSECSAEEALEFVRLGSGLTKRGASEFIGTPLLPAGRTLDRVIKKVLAGKTRRAGLASVEPASTRAAKGTGRETDEDKWLTVTQAAELLVHDLPGLTIKKARSRISTAASRGEFKTTGSRRSQRVEPVSFAAWRLKQRDKDLDAEDDR